MPFIQLQFRRGTASEWLVCDPVLASGEMGIETDTDLFKIGDGTTVWSLLPYGGLQGPTGPTGPTGSVGATGPGFIPLNGMTATGGDIVNTYSVSGVQYTAHTFTSSGTFTITNFGPTGSRMIDMIAIGGGGGGGGPGTGSTRRGGGGGAGSVLYFENIPLIPRGPTGGFTGTTGPWNITITIATGGASVGGATADVVGNDGGDTSVTFPADLFRNPVLAQDLSIVASGGGGGGGGASAGRAGRAGYGVYPAGSATFQSTTAAGGGGSSGVGAATAGGAGSCYFTAPGGDASGLSFSGGGRQGGAGSTVSTNAGAGGGGCRSGGFGSGVQSGGPQVCGVGGSGFRCLLDGTVRCVGGGGEGGGTTRSIINQTGRFFGGGQGYASGDPSPAATAGTANTGGGGGGGWSDPTTSALSGAGGSGLVIIRYQS